jgi:hypothetical protein
VTARTPPEHAAEPYVAPLARLVDPPEADAPGPGHLLRRGVGASVLLALLAEFMFWLSGIYHQVFTSFGTRAPEVTEAVMEARLAWFALPALALVLTVAAWRSKLFALEHRRSVARMLLALAIASMILAAVVWSLLAWGIHSMANSA